MIKLDLMKKVAIAFPFGVTTDLSHCPPQGGLFLSA